MILQRAILSIFVLVPLCKSTIPSELTTITIKSDRASCQQEASDKKFFTLSYLDHVSVDFSDGAHATADRLTVIVNTNKQTEKPSDSKKSLNQVKKITLSQRVSLFYEDREAYADEATIIPTTQDCQLSGNVRIVQKKTSNKDFPVEINCSHAAMNLISGKIELTGTSEAPVSTTLVINKIANPARKKHKSHHGKNPTPLAK